MDATGTMLPDERSITALIAADRIVAAEAALRDLHAAAGARLWSANLLAVCLRRQGRHEEAIPLYRRLLETAPQEGGLWGNLANALADALRWQEALAAHRHGLALRPGDAEAWVAYGRTLARTGDGAAARDALRQALALGPDSPPQVHWDIALTLLAEGRYAEAWPLYHHRWATPRAEARRHPGDGWDGTADPAATLFLYAEQGFGDTIQCLRYLPLAAARMGRLVLAVQPELRRLAEATLPPGTSLVPAGTLPEPGWHRASLLDLPGLFSASPAAIPASAGYLRPPAAEAARLRPLIRPDLPGLRVGIIWSGNAGFLHNNIRRAGLADFLRAFDQPGIRLFSLQKGPPAADLAATPDARVTDLAPHLADFADTAAACAQLDLVVMTDSAVAHLCGALGLPVWVMLGPLLHWPWGKSGPTTPWYDSVRLFRQPAPGCWPPVFDAVAGEVMRRGAGGPGGRLCLPPDLHPPRT